MESERGARLVEKLELDYYYGKEAEQFTFYRLPKALITDERFKGISNNAKLLYGLMLDRMSLSKRRGWLDDDNKVYIKYSLNNIEEDLNVSRKTAGAILKELEGIGLIDMIQQTGVANVIYVKNFVSERRESTDDTRVVEDECKKESSVKKEPVEKMHQCNNSTSVNSAPVENGNQCKNATCESFEPVENLHQCNFDTETGEIFTQVPVENLHPINNNPNNEMSYNNHISLSYQQVDPRDEATAYMELIRENIDYDIMMSDRNWRDSEMYDELYQIICDVVCVPRKTIRIGGEEYPYNLVKSKFLKLNSSHLQYVISCMQNNTTKVANIKAYLITALYNAPNTISHYYNAEVNHDLYGID